MRLVGLAVPQTHSMFELSQTRMAIAHVNLFLDTILVLLFRHAFRPGATALVGKWHVASVSSVQ